MQRNDEGQFDRASRLVPLGAELHTVADGLITAIKIIFDRQPFIEARGSTVN